VTVLTFKVKGSEGDIYTITAKREGNKLTMTCTCQAGQHNIHCKHRIALLNGDVSNLVGDDVGDVRLLQTMLIGTDVEAALGKVDERESDVEKAQKSLRVAKKILDCALGEQ
jgi:hypothetical protein